VRQLSISNPLKEIDMEELSWMKPDFDLGKVLSSDESGNYRATLERALDDLSRRLLAQRSNARGAAAVEQLSRLIVANELAYTVVDAAHAASHGR
jgi:hypothetical protein